MDFADACLFLSEGADGIGRHVIEHSVSDKDLIIQSPRVDVARIGWTRGAEFDVAVKRRGRARAVQRVILIRSGRRPCQESVGQHIERKLVGDEIHRRFS